MVSIDDFNLVELVFGESGSTLELIFAASALIGGVLFLFWFLLMLIGGVGEGPVSYTHLTLPTTLTV